MYKYMTILLFVTFIARVQVNAQELYTLSSSDSITYQYYLKGDWEKLLDAGKESIKQNIDYKWLRQRMGYAYFVKADYYASQQQYEKALSFDKTDSISLIYLYHCALNTNNESSARYYAGKLPLSVQNRLDVKPLRILDAVDGEYNYKINGLASRSNPGYYRAGLNSKPGYRLNLYQAFSTYHQRIDSAGIRQNEYFALLDYSLNAHLSLDIGYHYLGTSVVDTSTYRVNMRMKRTVIDSTFYPGHLFYTRLSYRINRFDIGISASMLTYDSVLTQQYGLQAGILLPGTLSIYLKSSLYGLFDPSGSRLIFSQTAGTVLFNRIWAQGEITIGNMKNFSESNGLYIYNADDATTFRTGLSLFWYVSKKITLFGNYSFNRKEFEKKDNSTSNYNQHSISTGIIWKI
jgi:hypothetical protein